MNTSNSNRLTVMVFGLIVLATTAANAQQQRFAPPQQSSQHARLGIQTTFQQVGIKNGTVVNYGERINQVRPGSPAAQAGLEAGDTIVGFYLGNSYRNISRKLTLEYATSAARGRLRVKVINYRNGQYVDATISVYAGDQSENGNGGGGLTEHDHRDKNGFYPYPTTAPPAPQYQIPAARAGYVWIRGHYEWRKQGGSYQWIRGHWEGKKANNAAWMDGHWSKQGSCWVWTNGYWTKVGPTVKVTRR